MDADRSSSQCAESVSVDAVSEACDHDYQWHPQSEDFGVCSKCGAEAEEEDS